ncbi:MAG: hypothetical protein NXI04_24610 [Planctomycetaceae bacterium]|nr:hypothetical protein [Planctomycetaceae bacterium]
MKLVEEGPKTQWDVSAFVNYQTEELTTPTEKELNEELPEWEGRAEMERKIEEKESRPRRGVGFLRAENVDDLSTSETTTGESSESDFGDGLFEKDSEGGQGNSTQERRRPRGRGGRGRGRGTEKPVEAGDQPTDSAAEGDETPGKTGRKRRRRRNRKSRRNSDKSDAATSVDSSEPPESEPTSVAPAESAELVGSSADDSIDSADEGAPKKKRRRRRRRNRKKSGSEGQAGDTGPSGDTTGGDSSQP